LPTVKSWLKIFSFRAEMITKIDLYKQSLHSDDHMVIATPVNYNPKSQRILVSVNNKVAEADYNPQTKNVTAKLVVPQNNANHPLAAQLPKNADMRVKVFVYDFLQDKILGAKLQEFTYCKPILGYKASDELLTTSPVIVGTFDLKALTKVSKIENGKSVTITGFWAIDKEGKKKITETNLGNLVYFHIHTKNIDENTKLIFRLSDNDGLLKPDSLFQTIVKDKQNQKNKIVKKELDKQVIIKNNKAVLPLLLDENWAPMIEKDLGNHIELQWKVYATFFEKTIAVILDVGYSKKHLFLKPAFENYNLPEMLTEKGETIIFSIGDLTKEEVKKQVGDSGGYATEVKYF
jgi:hypothetical protein